MLAESIHGALELLRGRVGLVVHLVQHRLVLKHVRDGLVGVSPHGAVGSSVRDDLPDGPLGCGHECHDVLHALLGGDRLSEAGGGKGERGSVADGAVRAHDAVNDGAEVSLVGKDVDEGASRLDALGEVINLGDVGLALPVLQLGILSHGIVAGVVGVDESGHEFPDRLDDNGDIVVEGEGFQSRAKGAVDEALVLEKCAVVVGLEVGSLPGGVDLVCPRATG